MSVTAIFNVVEGSKIAIENAIGQCKSLHFKGKVLVDEHDRVLAELIEDPLNKGRWFWQLFARNNELDPFKPRNSWNLEDKGLYQEIVIVGQGKLNI